MTSFNRLQNAGQVRTEVRTEVRALSWYLSKTTEANKGSSNASCVVGGTISAIA